ncbi:hypothetical protein F5Y04DRAFT_120992 [Hypomontagnella monticulosa]|nr:hypothetical protein F5Y04DRAFT_120992 [Hypomontagnella monticulosa]
MSSSRQQASQGADQGDIATPTPRPRHRGATTMSSMGRTQASTSGIPVSTSSTSLRYIGDDENAQRSFDEQSGIPRSIASQDLSTFLSDDDNSPTSQPATGYLTTTASTSMAPTAPRGRHASHNHPGPLTSHPVLRTPATQSSAARSSFTSSAMGSLRSSQTMGNIPVASSFRRDRQLPPQTLATVPEVTVAANTPRIRTPPDSAVAGFWAGNTPSEGGSLGTRHRDSLEIRSSMNVPRLTSQDDSLDFSDVSGLPSSSSTLSFTQVGRVDPHRGHTQQRSISQSVNPMGTHQAQSPRVSSFTAGRRDRPVLLQPYVPRSGTTLLGAQQPRNLGTPGTQIRNQVMARIEERDDLLYLPPSNHGPGETLPPNIYRQDDRGIYAPQNLSGQPSTRQSQHQVTHDLHGSQNLTSQTSLMAEQPPATGAATPTQGQMAPSSEGPIAGSVTPTQRGLNQPRSLIPRPTPQSKEPKSKKWSGLKIPKSHTLSSISNSIASTFSRSNLPTAFGRRSASRNPFKSGTTPTASASVSSPREPVNPAMPELSQEAPPVPVVPEGVDHWKDSHYWSGRFITLNDRFRSEALQQGTLQTLIAANVQRERLANPDMARLPPPTTQFSSEEMAAALRLTNRENRHRRVFQALENACRNREALDSLHDFQLQYARSMDEPSALPPGGTMEVIETDDDLKGEKELRKKKDKGKGKWIPPSLIGYDPYKDNGPPSPPGPSGSGFGTGGPSSVDSVLF